MVTLYLRGLGVQARQCQRSAQGVNDSQDLLKSHRVFATLQVNDETQAHSGGKG
jgi:hypothetical protein